MIRWIDGSAWLTTGRIQFTIFVSSNIGEQANKALDWFRADPATKFLMKRAKLRTTLTTSTSEASRSSLSEAREDEGEDVVKLSSLFHKLEKISQIPGISPTSCLFSSGKLEKLSSSRVCRPVICCVYETCICFKPFGEMRSMMVEESYDESSMDIASFKIVTKRLEVHQAVTRASANRVRHMRHLETCPKSLQGSKILRKP